MTTELVEAEVTRGFDPARHIVRLRNGEYLEVKWRLVWLRTAHPDSLIETDMVHFDPENRMAVFRAKITLPTGGFATGYGSETSDDFKDFIEKAETKAIGRACAALGFGTQHCQDFDYDHKGEGKVVDAPVPFQPKAKPAPVRPATDNGEGLSTRIRNATSLEELEKVGREIGQVVTKDSPFRKKLVEDYDAKRKALSSTERTQQAAQIFDAPEPEQTSMPALAQSVGPNNALATKKQLDFLAQVARDRGMSGDQLNALCWEKYGYGIDSLTKSQATQFIDSLKQPV